MGGGSLDGNDSLIGFGGIWDMAACGESIHVIGVFYLPCSVAGLSSRGSMAFWTGKDSV